MALTAPLTALCQSAMQLACGEFICAASTVEIHVFLQRGRLAWATDSKHPFAFAKRLQAVANIDPETFRQVVDECRQRHLPLGESLVEWGLVSWDTVRSCLRHQIEQAISLLGAIESAPTLFLERSYAEYNEQLTFSLDEFVTFSESARKLPLAFAAAPTNGARLTRQLRDTVPGISWAEIVDGDRVIEAEPDDDAQHIPLPLLRSTLHDGADFVAVRSSRGSLLGLSFAQPERSLWCQLTADSTFGAAVSALWSMSTDQVRFGSGAVASRRGEPWTVCPEPSPTSRELTSFMERAEQVLGVVVLADYGGGRPLAACGYEGLEIEGCLDFAARRSLSLSLWQPPISADDESLDSVGFTLRTMVTGERRLWCFGAELPHPAGHTAWMFIDRRNAQGLGWAYLSALTRVLGRPAAAWAG